MHVVILYLYSTGSSRGGGKNPDLRLKVSPQFSLGSAKVWVNGCRSMFSRVCLLLREVLDQPFGLADRPTVFDDPLGESSLQLRIVNRQECSRMLEGEFLSFDK